MPTPADKAHDLPFRDNPHGEDFLTMPDDGRRYVVLHSGVGSLKEGAVVSAAHFGPGAQIPRLLTMDPPAIRQIADHETDLLAQFQPTIPDVNAVAEAKPKPGPPAGTTDKPKV